MLHLLEKCSDDQWAEREKYWIAEYRRSGHPICNLHPGGNSRSPGFTQFFSDETRKKISETLKGRPLHPAFLARQKLVDKEHLAMMNRKSVLVSRGRKWPEDVKKRISESNKKSWTSERREKAKVSGRVAGIKQWSGMSTEQRIRYANKCRPNPRLGFKDITAHAFNKLTAMWPVGKDRFGQAMWLFQCDCGNLHIAKSGDVRSGNTKSCGCLAAQGRV